MPGTSGAKTALCAFCPGMTTTAYGPSAHSFRRTHLHRTGGAAAVARGVVHVLDIGLRQHIFAGRHRTHDVGDREDRRVVGGAIDRGGEAVVAELGVLRLLAVLDPVERAAVAG